MRLLPACKMRLLVAALLFQSLLRSARSDTDAGDAKVMSALAKSINAEKSLGWNLNADPCSWKGVACGAGGRVVGIDFQSKSVEGTLPSNFNQLSGLASLSIQNNKLSGPLPSFSGMSNLKSVFVNNNQFTSVPDGFFKGLTSLQVIGLDNNPFKPWNVPEDLTGSSNLINFTATSAGLTGSIPSFFGDQLPSLFFLSLALNNLSGPIPQSFSSSNMAMLWLNSQLLTGDLGVIAGMTYLVQLWLHSNSFTGQIPDLSKLVSLRDIKLSSNKLTGLVPQSLMDLPALTNVSLVTNELQGPYPSFPDTVATDLGNNYSNSFCLDSPGPCDPRVNTLLEFAKDLGYPYVFASSWKGNNPCSSWMYVSCDGNGDVTLLNMPNLNLRGTLSPALANLTSLSRVILNNNDLTGTIPSQLTSLTKLTKLDLRNNNLSGKAPDFRSNVQVLLDGNPNIGKDVSPSTPSPPGSSSDSPSGGSSTASSPKGSSPSKGGSSSSKTPIIIGAICGVAVLGLIGCLYFCLVTRRKKHGRVQSPNSSSHINPHNSGPSDSGLLKVSVPATQSNTVTTDSQGSSFGGPSDLHVVESGNMIISIQVLRTVTNDFSEQNVLGRGGFGVVYKGELHDGTKIAVKRMESGVVSGKGLNEFQAEIAVLTKVRHRHLVALLGYCIEGNERLLVYEYMPQGPLSHHLFEWEQRNLKPLDWSKRLTIALDVARGVEYLHSLAQKSFIHRDLKPSNILLGDDLRAKVSDFGLVRLAPDGKYSVETRLAGTFGYLAPEYAVTGRVTTKADVFSYGVVLMELITGRKALDESQPEESMHLVTWFRRMHINKENFRNAVDKNLEITDETFKSMCTVAELAGYCTAREPFQRPDMGHAVNVLSSLVEQWKPTNIDDDDIYGIDLDLSLPQALKKWQSLEDSNMDATSRSMDNTQTSIPNRPSGFADSFTSTDGR